MVSLRALIGHVHRFIAHCILPHSAILTPYFPESLQFCSLLLMRVQPWMRFNPPAFGSIITLVNYGADLISSIVCTNAENSHFTFLEQGEIQLNYRDPIAFDSKSFRVEFMRSAVIILKKVWVLDMITEFKIKPSAVIQNSLALFQNSLHATRVPISYMQ